MNEENNRIEQMLHDFEALQTIEPSAAWQQSVIDRLATTTPDAPMSLSTKSLVAVGLLFVGLNIGFILKETTTVTAVKTSARLETSTTLDAQRVTGFETISKELFINPTSINR
jgi:hypothetical protein